MVLPQLIRWGDLFIVIFIQKYFYNLLHIFQNNSFNGCLEKVLSQKFWENKEGEGWKQVVSGTINSSWVK